MAVLRAEWTKLRTSPGTVGLLCAVAAGTAATGAAVAATVACPSQACLDPARTSLTGVQLGQAVVAILAVLLIGEEYGSGMVRVTLAAVPRRLAVLGGKAAVLSVVVAAAAAVGVAGSLLAGRLLLPGRGAPLVLGGAAVLRAAAGSVLYLVLVALLGLGVATAVRNSGAAVGVVLALLYLFPVVTEVVGDPAWRRHLEQVSPMSAGLAVQATTGLRDLPIGPWAGLGVLAAWSAAALLAGGLLLRLRDA